MKSNVQQQTIMFSLKIRVSLLLFFLLNFLNFPAQIFYSKDDVVISVTEDAKIYVIDSSGLEYKVFEPDVNPQLVKSEQKDSIFSNKKLNQLKAKTEKHLANNNKKKKIIPKGLSSDAIKLCPENFFHLGQVFVSNSSNLTLRYQPKFIHQNIKFKVQERHPVILNRQSVCNYSDNFQDYYLSKHSTRPPPSPFFS